VNRRRLTVRCPAKVNLALRVIRRRGDGYHELDTVFQAIDLWDSLSGVPSEQLTLKCDAPDLPVDDSNLVLRAARLLSESVEGRPGAALELNKSIPRQAGLGGGSSDAAGALVLCAQLWGLDLDPLRLAELAGRLGADVPFFLSGGTARGRGRGDRIESLPPLAPVGLLLGVPPFGISTAEVFGAVADKLTLPRNGVSLPRLLAHKWPEGNDFRFATNDLEEVVFEGWPVLREFRDALLEVGAVQALLSGSGSTVYGIFVDATGASEASRPLRSRFEQWTIQSTKAVRSAVHITDRAGSSV